MTKSRPETKKWSIYFNRKRTLGSYLWLAKWYLSRAIASIPYRLTARFRKLPDFLIIGVAKGGTSSLYSYLSQHPDLELSREQEIHYFASFYNRGINYYRSFFPLKSSTKMTGESSPYYFFHPQAPSRIKRDLPNARIILLLRDPVKRAYSNYNMVKSIDWVKSFDEAVSIEKDRILPHHERIKTDPNYKNQHHQTFSYITRGYYSEQLENWLKHYNREDILILKSEEFFQDPKNTLREVYAYLGIDEKYPQDLTPKNSRVYEQLPDTDYQRYKRLFTEDAEKVRALLGDRFTW